MSKLTQILKSLLSDAGIVGLFVGGWTILDGIVFTVPSETVLGVAITLFAAVLRFIAKAAK